MRQYFAENKSTHRIAYATAAGLLTLASPWPGDGALRGLPAWTVGAAVYLVLAWWLAVEFDARRTRERAQAQDQPGLVVFLVLVGAVIASVAAIASLLQRMPAAGAPGRPLHIALAMFALAASWLLIQTLFAFRYAHRYYQEEMRREPDGAGLEFPGGQDPDYFDFMYYSYVVGMTSQVSDVQVTSREMRRLTLVHGVLSFAFNMLVLALSINVVAGAM
ncbi:DUF1345 domain-containing protein [Xylophilus sp.]|uniref:DUF1345 domain-containing protein n=1 Tax=Xylophilus sp. TaxID=2653893 RepID=UPI0013BDAD14|nr:DUF1345 domain-containing protein [Xylophilus sp.]KAF1047306.1 MAG: hypothetical protein GAK38_02019 [Xylophilus sp.]